MTARLNDSPEAFMTKVLQAPFLPAALGNRHCEGASGHRGGKPAGSFPATRGRLQEGEATFAASLLSVFPRLCWARRKKNLFAQPEALFYRMEEGGSKMAGLNDQRLALLNDRMIGVRYDGDTELLNDSMAARWYDNRSAPYNRAADGERGRKSIRLDKRGEGKRHGQKAGNGCTDPA